MFINKELQETKKEDDKEKENNLEEKENNSEEKEYNSQEKENKSEEKENSSEEKETNPQERENNTEETENKTEEKGNNAEKKESEVSTTLEDNHTQSVQLTFTGPRNQRSTQTSLGPIPRSPTPSFESIGDDEREMDHVIMKENRWDYLYPNEVKNQFIKQVI